LGTLLFEFDFSVCQLASQSLDSNVKVELGFFHGLVPFVVFGTARLKFPVRFIDTRFDTTASVMFQ